MYCSILLNTGPFPAHTIPIIKDSSYIIAADGAWNYCQTTGIVPNVIIGDMDSAVNIPSSIKNIKVACQDTTDCQKAIQHAISLGYKNIRLVGIQGDRLDHSIFHLQIMLRYYKKVSITAYTQTETCFLASGKCIINGKVNQRVSLMSLNQDTVNLTTTGLYWQVNSLNNLRSSVSNKFKENTATINIDNDKVIFVIISYL